MRVVQTTNKKLVFAILLSVLTIGVMLTIGQVPLAVSQPVTIPTKAIKGPIPMDGINPIWERIPGVVVPLSGQSITIPMHPNIAVKSVFVKAMTNGHPPRPATHSIRCLYPARHIHRFDLQGN